MPEPLFVARSYGENPGATDLAVAILGATDMSFTVGNAASWLESHGANVGQPLGTSGPFTVVVDAGMLTEEHILCSGVNTSTGVVTVYNVGGWNGRGYGGAAQAHGTAAGLGLVYPIWSSPDSYEANWAAFQTVGRVTTKGDVLGATGLNAFGRVPVGPLGTVLTSAPAQPTGLAFAPPGLTPTPQGANYAAQNNDMVLATAALTVNLPAPATGLVVGVKANYVATHAAPVTITTPSGAITGPGVGSPGFTGLASILLGAPQAFVVLVAGTVNWHVVAGQADTGWTALTPLGTGWTADSVNPVMYRLVGSRVTLRGGATFAAGQAAIMATLPAGYRPSNNGNWNALTLETQAAATYSVLVQVAPATDPVQPGAMTVSVSVAGGTPREVWFDDLSFAVD